MAYTNYPMYGNNQFYMQELQGMKDRIDSQMRQMQQQSQQMQQPQQSPTNLTQNFQITPQQNNTEFESRYANNIDEVRNTFVMKTGLFIDKEMNNLWIKNINGDIKTFTLTELIETDPKDTEIMQLRKEIEELKGVIANESTITNVNEEIPDTKSTRIPTNKRSNAK